ncbi:MAG: hypothetical protein ACJAZO_001078 [Myxococcota bacterium]|jgi:hypothetical protein
MEPRASWTSRGVVPKYCSAGCRRHKPTKLDRELEDAVLRLLDERSRNATICPSEAARAVTEEWHPLMERARRAARRLVAAGRVVITQKGRVVDPSTAKGPIRIRKVDP